MKVQKLIAGGMMAAILTVGLTGVVNAASLSTNGSFETGTDPGVFSTLVAGDTTTIPDWTVVSGSVDYIGTYWDSADGDRSLDLTGVNAGAVSQTLSTVAGHSYTVKFDLAGNPEGAPVVKTLNVDAGGVPTVYTFDTTGKTLTDMGWQEKTYTFTATGASTTLTFASQDDTFFGPALDNVRITDQLTSKDQCKNGGWMAYTDPSFKNQGDCVSYFQSNSHALGNKNQ